MLRDENGKFKTGNKGFWFGKKRSSVSGAKNWRWVGDRNYHDCLACGKRFRRANPSNGVAKYCSGKCYGKSKILSFSGSNNPRWNGGVTDENKQIRHSPQYKGWQKKVFCRDYWTCQMCKRHLKRLVAHHIKTFKKYPELRFEVSNGLTLCRACHCKLHAENRGIENFTKILNDYMPDISRKTTVKI